MYVLLLVHGPSYELTTQLCGVYTSEVLARYVMQKYASESSFEEKNFHIVKAEPDAPMWYDMDLRQHNTFPTVWWNKK